MRGVGEGQAARELAEHTLARRRVLGEDHPDTLASADNLAFSLQGVRGQAARELGEDTWKPLPRRRVLGEDHPDTLASASNLVIILGRVGEEQAARELGRRHPGPPPPASWARTTPTPWPPPSTTVCWVPTCSLGEHHAARELNHDIIARRRRVLGAMSTLRPTTAVVPSTSSCAASTSVASPKPTAALREASKSASKRPGS